MRNTFYLISACILLLHLPLGAQDTSAYFTRPRTEIGLNITGVLANFLNAEGSNLPVDPYLFSLKIVRRNTIRFGLNSKVNKFSDFADGFNQRVVKEWTFQFRAGIERRIAIQKRLIVHWGGDVLADVSDSRIESSGGFGRATLRSTTAGGGLGPVLGLQFAISRRMTLSSESAMYFVARQVHERQDFDFGPPVVRKRTEYVFNPYVPSALYLNIAF